MAINSLSPFLLLVGCSILTAACGPSTLADAAPEYEALPAATAAPGATAPDLQVWTADSALAGWVELAAGRITATSGLRVAVTDSTADADIPVFWVDRADWADDGWWGLTHMADGGAVPEYLGVGANVPGYMLGTVVLHELLHALGAHHVGQGLGVLSPQAAEQFPVTEVDLTELCSVCDCPTFQPEN